MFELVFFLKKTLEAVVQCSIAVAADNWPFLPVTCLFFWRASEWLKRAHLSAIWSTIRTSVNCQLSECHVKCATAVIPGIVHLAHTVAIPAAFLGHQSRHHGLICPIHPVHGPLLYGSRTRILCSDLSGRTGSIPHKSQPFSQVGRTVGQLRSERDGCGIRLTDVEPIPTAPSSAY